MEHISRLCGRVERDTRTKTMVVTGHEIKYRNEAMRNKRQYDT
jgi:hypothetical protein